MTMNYQRLQILESLGMLDSEQSQQVLDYIKGLSGKRPDDATYKRFKHEAMREIRNALNAQQING